MKIVMPDELRSVVARIFMNRGVPDRDADIIAGSVVHADLRGVASHGVMRIPHYVKRLELGSINATPRQQMEWTAASTGTLSGDDGFGHVAVWDAMDAAIERAQETGIAFVAVNNSSHCGALSYFASQAVERDMIGLVMSQTDAAVVPFGGRKPFCGTNPICFGIPSRQGPPVVLDMATSTVAGGHIFKARFENRPIPPSWALDEEGNPTTDPHKGVYFTPAAGAKGYGLAVIIDILTGILSGGVFGPHVVQMYGQFETKRKLCHLAAAIDYNRFAGSGTFLDGVASMVSEIHEVEPAEGFESVLAPGEPEYIKEQERWISGIPLEDYIWQGLMDLLPSREPEYTPEKL